MSPLEIAEDHARVRWTQAGRIGHLRSQLLLVLGDFEDLAGTLATALADLEVGFNPGRQLQHLEQFVRARRTQLRAALDNDGRAA